ncbi:MAG: ribosome biogenesis GTPase Der [Thermotogae bacterium]|nr:ribosome biogenesis GTPase Der [Thermotogota bacterium]
METTGAAKKRFAKELKKVLIVGRTNVGKSTLFNRIVGKPLSITSDVPGTTRDVIYKPAEWGGRMFLLADSGGAGAGDKLANYVWDRVRKAIKEADLILLMVDVKSGILPLDEELARMIKKAGKKAYVVVNKIDATSKAVATPEEFFRLGFEDIFPISAAHGWGVGDLLDAIVEDIPPESIKRFKKDKVRVAILGRPNAGKSSILNYFAGKPIAIVSPTAGTTRDAVDVELDDMIVVDTAGITRRFKDDLSYYSYVRSKRSLRYAEVGLVVIDAEVGVHHLDKKIVSMVINEGRGLVIAMNKIDVLNKKEKRAFFAHVEEELKSVWWAPKVPVSALTGEGMDYLRSVLKGARSGIFKRISKRDARRLMEELASRNLPPTKIYDFYQIRNLPPTFLIKAKAKLPDFYLRYIENALRERWGFFAAPIRFITEAPY